MIRDQSIYRHIYTLCLFLFFLLPLIYEESIRADLGRRSQIEKFTTRVTQNSTILFAAGARWRLIDFGSAENDIAVYANVNNRRRFLLAEFSVRLRLHSFIWSSYFLYDPYLEV